MADNEIKIPIQVTGTQEAAGELKTVEAGVKAVADAGSQGSTAEAQEAQTAKMVAAYMQKKQAAESLGETEEVLAKKRAQFMTAAEAEAAEVQRLATSAKKLEVANIHLAESKDTVTKKGVQMGTGMQNVGYQVQDLAVQIGSGQSAFRALGQQLPQLLSGFGPLGITLGTVSAVALPLAGAMFTLGDATNKAGSAAEETEKRLDRLNTALDKQKEKVKETIKAKRESDNAAWIKSLDAEEKYYENINSQLVRQIAHQTKLRALKEGTDNAKREAKIAEIEADPNKPELVKIAEVAAIKEEGARAKVDAEKKALDDAAAIAADAADKAQAKADRQTADAATASAERARLEKESAELNAKLTAGGVAQARMPKLEKDLKQAEALMVQAWEATNYDKSNPMVVKAEEKYKTLGDLREAAKRDIAVGAGAGAKFSGTAEDLKLKKEAEQAQKKEAEAARKEAEDAYNANLYSQALAREGKPQIEERYQVEKGQRSSQQALKEQTERKRIAEDQARQEKERLNAVARANQLRIEISPAAKKQPPTRRASGPSISNSSKGLKKKPQTETLPGGGESVSKALNSLASEIGGADNTADINAVKEAVKAKSGEMNAAMISVLNEMISKQEGMVKNIADLKRRIDRMP